MINGVETYINFIADNYLWIMVIGIVLVMALIGYYVEKYNNDKVNKLDKSEENLKEKLENVNIQDRINEVSNVNTQSAVNDAIENAINQELNSKEDLTVPFGEPLTVNNIQTDQTFLNNKELYSQTLDSSNNNLEQPSIETPEQVEKPLKSIIEEPKVEIPEREEMNEPLKPVIEEPKVEMQSEIPELKEEMPEQVEELDEPFKVFTEEPLKPVVEEPKVEMQSEIPELKEEIPELKEEIPEEVEELDEPFKVFTEESKEETPIEMPESNVNNNQIQNFDKNDLQYEKRLSEIPSQTPTYEKLFVDGSKEEPVKSNSQTTEELINRLKELNLPDIDSLKNISEKMQSEDDVWKF